MRFKSKQGLAILSGVLVLLVTDGVASAMNKAELIDAIASDAGLSKADAKRALDGFTNSTAAALKKGDRVALVGFGSFSVSRRLAEDSCEEVNDVLFSFDLDPRLCSEKRCAGCTTGDEDVAAAIARSAGLEFEEAVRALAALKDAVVVALAVNESVRIGGFGSFQIVAEVVISDFRSSLLDDPSDPAARTGRNPQTGKEIKIAAKKVVKFKAGADLSKKVN